MYVIVIRFMRRKTKSNGSLEEKFRERLKMREMSDSENANQHFY